VSERVSVRFDEGWRRTVPAGWTASWAPERFELEGGWTEVLAMGEGPPLLLLPPLPGYKESWIRTAPLFARRHRVVTFDLRRRFAGTPSWDQLVRDLERIADRYAPGRAAVVGHSLGGALAQRWAATHPERVGALVLSSTFERLENPPSHWWLRFGEQPLVLMTQRFLPRAMAMPIARALARRGAWVYDAHCDEAVLELVRHGIRTLPIADAMSAIRLAFAYGGNSVGSTRLAGSGTQRPPTLIVVAERESAVAVRASQRLAAGLGATLAVLPGANHLHPLSRPEAFVGIVSDWLGAHLR
jgi:pimeloyl-ACP methyl ester carboxylesterase